jgi:glycosyltransferase involved in cell wall biosynthesis
MNNKGIIIINYTGRKGGGALDSLEISKALVENGEKVVPIISDSIDNLEEWYKVGFEKIITIKTYHSPLSFVFNSLFFVFSQKRVIKKAIQGLDIKAVFSPMIAFWTGKINRLFNDSLKAIVVHDPIHHSGSNKFVDLFLDSPYKSADFLIVHSKKFVDYTKQKYKRRTYYYPLGPHDHYSKSFVSRLPFPYDKKRINFLFFGRIEEYKGIDTLIDAFLQLEKGFDNQISLTIVGEGDISKYSDNLHKSKNITVVNEWISDNEIGSYFYGDNIVCVCPYKDATQSGIVLMSYAFGVPVIASDTGGLNEQVINDKTGLLIEPNNVNSLLSAMKTIVLNPFSLEKMKKNISGYLNEISWNSSAKKLLSFFDEETLIKNNCK